MPGQLQRWEKLQPWQHGAAFPLACVILISRRPDAIFQAQFFAEDGRVWFADAYNMGWWAALFQTHTGYFQTLPRLAASLALLAPLIRAPLVLNLIAIAVMALPINILLSARSSGWGSLRFRALMACIFLALPNSREMSYGITESQWLLALSAFLLIVGSRPTNFSGRLCNISILLLCGLTGPFCIFILPISIFLAWKYRDHWRWAQAGILMLLCLVQAWALFIVDPSGRTPGGGASFALGIRILAGQIYLGATLGSSNLSMGSGSRFFLFLLCVAIIGSALVAVCFARSTLEMKLFLLFTGMLLGASLRSPVVAPPAGITPWMALASTSGIRYWYFPVLAFAWSILWCFRSRNDVLKIVSAALLFLVCIGILRDWRYQAFEDLHFAQYAKRFEAAPVGTASTIPENPEGWNMMLIKH
jgi:hypothetical protein